MATILITGGAGFIGANLALRLAAEKKNKIFILDSFLIKDNIERLKNHENISVHQGDLKDRAFLQDILEEKDFVIHLAAHTYVLESVTNPSFNFEENAVTTFYLLEACAKKGVKHFVFASTGAVLGGQIPPIHEKMLQTPISPYGASKLVGESYCRVFSEISDMSCTALRFSNVYGPYSWHKTSVVAKFIKKILNGEEIEIYGDGSQTRDYLYVENLCELFIEIFESDYKFNVFQVASGVETPLNDLIDLLETKLGKNVKRKYLGFNKGEVKFNYADISKVKDLLSYQPKIQFEDGIEKTIDWFLSRHGNNS